MFGLRKWAISSDRMKMVVPETFDVITCLWNVLGHVREFENRVRAMRAMKKLLSPEGRCFIDVNHRYNARAYGCSQPWAD